MKTATTPVLFAVVGCLLVTSAVCAEDEPAPLKLEAKSLQADQLGPFTYGMPIEEAAKLCHVELTPEQKQAYQTAAIGKRSARETSMICMVSIGEKTFKVGLYFVAAALDHADLSDAEPPMGYDDSGRWEDFEWLRQTRKLLDVLRAAQPSRALQVGNYSAMKKKAEMSKPWTGTEPLDAKALLGELKKAEASPDSSKKKPVSLGVAWVGSNDPILYLNASDMALEFRFSQSPKKLQEAAHEKQREEAKAAGRAREAKAAAEKREQDRKKQLAQRIAIPVPELQPLEFGMPEDKVSRMLTTIKGMARCTGIKEVAGAGKNRYIDCTLRIAAGKGYLTLVFEEGFLARVTVAVQEQPQPTSTRKTAQHDATRLFRYMNRQFGRLTFQDNAELGHLDEDWVDKEATELAIVEQLRQLDMVGFMLVPSEPRWAKQMNVYGMMRRQQGHSLLMPVFDFRLRLERVLQ